jgi:hypothetical protein
MPDSPPQSSIILYQTEDGRTRIQCRFDNETIWLTQLQIAELFQTSVPNINLHLKALYAEGELTLAATIKSYLIVRIEGARQMFSDLAALSSSPTDSFEAGPDVTIVSSTKKRDAMR